jgi:hypothetical protein
LKSAQANSLGDLILKIHITKKFWQSGSSHKSICLDKCEDLSSIPRAAKKTKLKRLKVNITNSRLNWHDATRDKLHTERSPENKEST